MNVRILVTTIMFLSIFVSWWIGAVCALVLSVRYRAGEVILFGALLDTLWLSSNMWYGVPVATVISILMVWALEPLRRQFLFDYD